MYRTVSQSGINYYTTSEIRHPLPGCRTAGLASPTGAEGEAPEPVEGGTNLKRAVLLLYLATHSESQEV